MLQKSWLSRWTFYRYSPSISQRPSLSWIATQNWLDRAKVHRDGRVGKARSHVPSLQRGIQEIPRTVVLTLNKSGKNAPIRLRSDFRAAVSLKNRLHREPGEEVAQPIFPQQYRRWHSSSSDSWWNWDTSKSWWSSWHWSNNLHVNVQRHCSTKDNEDSCAITSRKIKEYASN